MSAGNYYRILGIQRGANLKQIRKAYIRESKLHHPDMLDRSISESEWAAANRRFQSINAAYTTLKDPVTRREYDRGLNAAERAPEASAPTHPRARQTNQPNRPNPTSQFNRVFRESPNPPNYFSNAFGSPTGIDRLQNHFKSLDIFNRVALIFIVLMFFYVLLVLWSYIFGR